MTASCFVWRFDAHERESWMTRELQRDGMAFHGGTPFVRGNLRHLIQRMEKDFFSFNVMTLIRNGHPN